MANFCKKYLVLILCGVLVLGALGAGVWYLVNPNTPAEPNDDEILNTTESTGDLEDDLDIDIGFGDMGGDSGSSLLPDGNSSSGAIVPVNPDSGNSSNSGSGNTGNNTGSNTGGGDSNQTIDMSGSVVENPF